jgi:cytoplasmic iron level regulating protein YaaA (DUF328/UPF0246 family)
MKVIISPAKRMFEASTDFAAASLPDFLPETKQLLGWLRSLNYQQSRKVWNCSEKIAKINYQRIQTMELSKNLLPAIMAYNGLQFQAMGPQVFSEKALKKVSTDLYILSGFYGVLRAFDGIRPYRLEMQAKIAFQGCRTLYDFWENKLYQKVFASHEVVINLASKEYAKAIEKYLQPQDRFITCVFKQFKNGSYIQPATAAKKARGDLVRFIAENQINKIQDLTDFTTAGYQYQPQLSAAQKLVFIKK